MTAFTALELAALRAIFSETPELAAGLERQLAAATVVERENSGGGFFTTIAVAEDAPRVTGPSYLGHETQARVAGAEPGFGFVLFMADGRLHMLEGYAWGSDTSALDFAAVEFEIYMEPLGTGG